ncbi:MAG: Holliday junction branch migration protein RuvA [Spirochaetales bacterium]|nr:Holliday junction branch migration protein RuvA [Spirochaetales bacterium]
MIDAVYGKIIDIKEQQVILHTGMFDIEVHVSALTSHHYSKLAETEKEDCRIMTYLLHREDSMMLYGFRNVDERNLFLEIIKVQGIGPKQAIKILSGITVENFISALDSGNVSVLTTIPGLGIKTAQKMILALRDKLTLSSLEETSTTTNSANVVHRHMISDIVQSLSGMGYDKRDAKNAVDSSISELGNNLDSTKEFEKKLFTAALMKLG